jgi:hypothetical protein
MQQLPRPDSGNAVGLGLNESCSTEAKTIISAPPAVRCLLPERYMYRWSNRCEEALTKLMRA